MNESTGDGGCNGASSFHMDLSKLVIWAHTHGTICNQIPSLEFIQNTGHLGQDNAVLWMCKVGHAYHWQFGKLHDTGGEGIGAVGRRRGRQFFEASDSFLREENFREKRLRLSPSSFERREADAGSVGSRGRSPGVTQQEADTAYTRHKEPSPRGTQNTRKLLTLCSAAEQHSTVSGVGVHSSGQHVKLKNDEDLLIISDEKQCVAGEDNQNNVSEPPAEVDLQMLHCQKMTIQQPSASQRPAFAPTAGPPLAHAYTVQSPRNNLEDPDRNSLNLGPFTAAGPMAETPGAKNALEPAAPKAHVKPPPEPSTEARAQLESCPLVTFFEFQATADAQQQLQLSSPECGTPGTESSGNSTENVAEESSPLGYGQAPSAFQSPQSHLPAASNRDVLKKQDENENCTTGNIKVFKNWLVLHWPSETREIHTLPPADLDRYLVLFFSSIKRHDGMDFSVHSFVSLKNNIEWYLKDHNYQYSVVRGLEFRASQKAWKLKYQHLFRKKREAEWSVLENLSDEDVKNLHKNGILSKTHPQGFLYLMFTSIVRGFGASTHSQSHHLYWGQLVLRSEGEVEYLEWKDDLSPEGNKETPGLRLFAKPNDPENCPITNYKEYARRRPPDTLNDDDPLYLAPRSLVSAWDEVWYSRKALTRVRIEKILRVITQQLRGVLRKSRR